MENKKRIFVVGAEGRQGNLVVQMLLDKGHQVKAIVENPYTYKARFLAKKGVEIISGNEAEPCSFFKAFRGTDVFFLMTSPKNGDRKEVETGKKMVDAIREAHIGHLIYSSIAFADRSSGVPRVESKFEIEQYIRKSGMPYTIIAPVFLMENIFHPFSLPGILNCTYTLPFPPERKIQYISQVDIAKFVNVLIGKKEAVFGRRYDIASDEETGQCIAGIISKVTGLKIRYRQIPVDSIRKNRPGLASIMEWAMRTDYRVDISALSREFPEMNWLTFKNWVDMQSWSLIEGGGYNYR